VLSGFREMTHSGSSRIIKGLPRIIKNIVLDADMETMKLRAHIGADGILQIQTPTDLKDTSVEVVVVVQPLPNAEVAASEETVPQYNAWGKPTTKKSISDAIAKRLLWSIALMRQLRREVTLDKTSIRSMIEEGRRF